MASEKKYVVEVDCETGKETKREFTAEEYAQAEQAFIQWQEQQAALEAQEQAKASALAKLASLGLTEDEAKAIVG